ncbi:unnamed protein product [Lampetra fluviatilis]
MKEPTMKDGMKGKPGESDSDGLMTRTTMSVMMAMTVATAWTRGDGDDDDDTAGAAAAAGGGDGSSSRARKGAMAGYGATNRDSPGNADADGVSRPPQPPEAFCPAF